MTTVGIVGCGNVARAHSKIIVERAGLSVAFCDRNLDKAHALADAHGSTSVYSQVDRMIANEQLKALHVLTRLDSHRSIAESALEAGVHVYVEKPITETKAEFEALRRLAEQSNLTFYPGFSALGSPAVQKAMELVRSRSYGRLVTVHCDYNWTASDGGIPYQSGDHPAYSMRGGILQNLADHPASLVVHFLDDVLDARSLRIKRSTLPHGVHDLLHVGIAGPDQIGSFTMSFGHGNARGTLACHLEGATIDVDLRSQIVTVTPLRGVPSLQKRVVAGLKTSAVTSGSLIGHAARRAVGAHPSSPEIAGLIDNFYAVIDTQAQPIVSLDKSAVVVDLLDSVWEAAA